MLEALWALLTAPFPLFLMLLGVGAYIALTILEYRK